MAIVGRYLYVEDTLIQNLARGETDLEALNLADCARLDVGRSWRVVLYLLCGVIFDGEPPLGYAVPLIDAQRLPFGDFGAFYITRAQVGQALEELEKFGQTELRARYNPAALREDNICPDLHPKDAERFFEEIYRLFGQIREFYRQAAACGGGILFYLL